MHREREDYWGCLVARWSGGVSPGAERGQGALWCDVDGEVNGEVIGHGDHVLVKVEQRGSRGTLGV